MRNKVQRFVAAGVIALVLSSSAVVAGDLSNLRVYPNPVREYLGDTRVVFDNITDGKITIYNAQGNRVREMSFDNVAFVIWDLTNDDGKTVASGVYIYLVDSDGQKKTGKLAVIR
jgi:hypothetical protein